MPRFVLPLLLALIGLILFGQGAYIHAKARVQVAALKRVQPVATQAPSTVTLPRTATDAELKMIAGVILLTLSLILFVFNRRQMSPR